MSSLADPALWPLVSHLLLGTFGGALLALLPGTPLVLAGGLVLSGSWLPPGLARDALVIGLAAGHAALGALPAVWLGIPDGGSYCLADDGWGEVRRRRGLQASALSAAGSLGAAVLFLAAAPLLPAMVVPLFELLRPHRPWIVLFIALSLAGWQPQAWHGRRIVTAHAQVRGTLENRGVWVTPPAARPRFWPLVSVYRLLAGHAGKPQSLGHGEFAAQLRHIPNPVYSLRPGACGEQMRPMLQAPQADKKSRLIQIVTTLLAGVCGLALTQGGPAPDLRAARDVAAFLAGLYTLPALLLALRDRVPLPAQEVRARWEAGPAQVGAGILAGTAGGLLSGLLPSTGGALGAYLTWCAVAGARPSVRLVAHGAQKTAATAGLLLLFYLPGLHLAPAQFSGLVSPLFSAPVPAGQAAALAGMALAAAIVFGLQIVLSAGAARLAARVPRRAPAAAWLAALLILLGLLTGWRGLSVAGLGTAIGLIPILAGAPRHSLLAASLLPAWFIGLTGG